MTHRVALARRVCGVAISIAALGAAAFGCRPAPPARPNLLWIVSDTLRADALRCHGGPAGTPNLCALAARGALFERAYSNAPWTLPASVSMFSSMAPSVFARVVPRPDGREPRVYAVPDEQWLFGEALAAAGFEVLAFVENAIAGQANTLQGFSPLAFEQPTPARLAEIREATGIDTRDGRYRALLPVLEVLLAPRSQPFALLVWIDDPHAAYVPPEWLRERARIDARELPRSVDFYLGLGHIDRPEDGLRKLKGHARELGDEEVSFLRELYQLEVESVDERVGAVLAALEHGGRLENTLVAFTSDHGESFREHRGFLHGLSYYEELIRVPLILAGPGVEPGRRVALPVAHVDLAPTLAELLGVAFGAGTQGRSYASALGGRGEPPAVRSAYIAGVQGRRYLDALIDGRFKLIERQNGRIELFDLVADPGERRDLAQDRPQVVARMQRELARIRADNAALGRRNAARLSDAAVQQLGDETETLLRDLGYVE